MPKAAIVIFLFLLTSLFCTAQALELWVDKGSLGGPCSDNRTREEVSKATPWCTLGVAGHSAQPDDTVNVRGGEYTESQTCERCNDTAVLQPLNDNVRFTAHQGESVRIIPRGNAVHGISIGPNYNGSAHPKNIKISGFEVSGASHNCVEVFNTSDVELSNLDVHGCGNGSMELHGTSRITVQSSAIHDNRLAGYTSAIDLYQCGEGNVVRGNRIWNNSDGHSATTEGHGIIMDRCKDNGSALIEGNEIWDNEGWCIVAFVSDNGAIHNNTCKNNGSRGQGAGEISVLGSRLKITNNIATPRKDALALNVRLENADKVSDWSTLEINNNTFWASTHEELIGLGDQGPYTVSEYRNLNPQGWGNNVSQVDPQLPNPDSEKSNFEDEPTPSESDEPINDTDSQSLLDSVEEANTDNTAQTVMETGIERQ